MRKSADGSVEETLSAAQSSPCACGRRDRGHLVDGRLYYRGTPARARTSTGRCLRLVSAVVIPALVVATVSVSLSPSVIAVIPPSSVIVTSAPRVSD